jgi:hypothetical protein
MATKKVATSPKKKAAPAAASVTDRAAIINRAYRVLSHASGIGTIGNKVQYINGSALSERYVPPGSAVKPSDKYTDNNVTYTVKGINDDGDVVLSSGAVVPYTSIRLVSVAVGKTIKLGDSGRSAQITNDGTGVVVGCTTFPADAVLEVAKEIERVRTANEAKAPAELSDDPKATYTKAMAAAEEAKKAEKKAAAAAKPKKPRAKRIYY